MMEDLFPSILVVDDDPDILRVLKFNLRADGYEVETASSGREALSALRSYLPQLAIVDLLLPDIHGFELARRMKAFVDLPIVFLTAVTTEESVVEGLERYAEDYVVKPFSYPQLLARVGRVLKRTRHLVPRHRQLALGQDVVVDLASHVVSRPEGVTPLTPTECRLIACLARNANHIVTTATLVDEVWGDYDGDPERLWVHMRNLRQKLEDDPDHPRYLLTHRGKGYSLALAGSKETRAAEVLLPS
jgi:DNA-binding response OmpR family regulator